MVLEKVLLMELHVGDVRVQENKFIFMKRIEFFVEENNVFILPTIRIYFEKIPNAKFRYVYLEIVWIRWAIGIKLIENL
jgi:hypothetical protein